MEKYKRIRRLVACVIIYYIIITSTISTGAVFPDYEQPVDILPSVTFVNEEKPVQTVSEVSEPCEPVQTVSEVSEPFEPVQYIQTISDSEIELIARVCYHEAGNQSDDCKRYVIDTILNRVDDPRFPNDILSVLVSPGQYTCVTDGGIYNYDLDSSVVELAKEEIESRSNYEVLYFCSWPADFSSWAWPYTVLGDMKFYIN